MSEIQNMHSEHRFTLFPSVSFHIGIDRVADATPARSRSYHYHDCYEMYYLYSGECFSFIKDRSFLAQGGNMILVSDYDIHCTIDTAKPGYRRLIITFKKEFLEGFAGCVDDVDLLECFRKNSPLVKLTPQEQHFAEHLFQSMMNEYRNQEPGCTTYLRTALIQLLILLNRHNDQPADEYSRYADAAHKIISEITGYINNHYRENITLSSISETFYISPYYFTRIFKRTTGFTFVEYLNGVRVKEAQRLLHTTTQSIAQIAEAVGYKSCTHFGRVFKNVTGMTPLAYRRQDSKELSGQGD